MKLPRATRSSSSLDAMTRLTLVGVALLALGACSTPTAVVTVTATPPATSARVTPTPTVAATVPLTVTAPTQIRDALIAAGYPCSGWTFDTSMGNGGCSKDDYVFIDPLAEMDSSLMKSELAIQKYAAKTAGALIGGKNWLVRVPAQYGDAVHKTLGGMRYI